MCVNFKNTHVKSIYCVFGMQRRWSGKNIDLERLSACIRDFFGERDFDVKMERFFGGYKIIAEGSSVFELDGCVNVAVEGCPDDFVVVLNFHGREGRRGFFVGPLTMALFGGGWLLVRRCRLEENWVSLEREFWKYVENTLLRLSNSV